MKAALLPIAFALTAGAAFAEGPIQGNEVFNFQSTLSRAEVQAQVAPAYRADEIARGEATPSQATVVASGLSRAQVQAEAAEAYRLGLVASGEILPIPSDAQHLHFGLGQTETTLTLSPGKHTLQLILGDLVHIPHNPVVKSEKITITVK